MVTNLKKIAMIALLVQIALVMLAGPVSADTAVNLGRDCSGVVVYNNGQYLGTAPFTAIFETGWHFIELFFGKYYYSGWFYYL
ncbi:MAG: hypothetical protein MUF37_05860 [Methanoregulaceae archaeon]|nr:hypothetical protein [Methanoregulaceae archaeon]